VPPPLAVPVTSLGFAGAATPAQPLQILPNLPDLVLEVLQVLGEVLLARPPARTRPVLRAVPGLWPGPGGGPYPYHQRCLWGANTLSRWLTCDVLSQPTLLCRTRARYQPRAQGITEGHAEEYRGSHEQPMRGLCPLWSRRGGSYGPYPPFERVPCAGPGRLLDHLLGYSGDLSIVV